MNALTAQMKLLAQALAKPEPAQRYHVCKRMYYRDALFGSDQFRMHVHDRSTGLTWLCREAHYEGLLEGEEPSEDWLTLVDDEEDA